MLKFKAPLLILILFTLSCKTTTPVVTATTNLEAVTMMQGDKKDTVWINKSLVVGIVMPGMDSVHRILDDQELMRDTARVLRTRLSLYGAGAPNFSFFRKVNGKPINQEDSQELEALRKVYHKSFGPGIYEDNGYIRGVLSNILSVDFKRRTPEKRIDEILNSHQAVKFFRWRDNVYYVEFSKGIGYEVLDIAKTLFEYEEVKSVEHQVQFIERHTG